MELRNPLFKNLEKDSSYIDDNTSCATVHGTFGKTLILILVTIASAIAAIAFLYNLNEENVGTFIGLLFASMIVALVSGLIATFSVRLCPVFSFIYAVSEGFMLGIISALCDLAYPGVALVAVVLTFVVTLIMGILYFTGIIKVGHKFKAFILTSFIAIILGSIILAILAAVNVPGMRDILYNPSNPIGWVIDVFCALIAALSLCIDFDYAARLADSGAEKKYEWKAAFCLTTSIIYLYLRILELVVRVAAASKK
ncbi:MAG: Bax inhibitor-1/YccA family protein [bacterium]|nr:Bax inhibitor-1/YccA family protein [bacterium]